MARGPVREALRLTWIRLSPSSYWSYYKWKRGLAEPEIALLPALCSPERRSLDVGANIGLYSYQLLQHSKECVAFEPLPPMAELLRSAYRSYGPKYRLEQLALSNQAGTVTLRMPKNNFGYTTMEPANVLEGKVDVSKLVTFSVETRALDSYDFDDIAFIKVDVEGHEETVLRGAEATLKRLHPSVLVEVENCHNPGAVVAVHEFMTQLGYGGWFFKNKRLHPFSDFNESTHQDRTVPSAYVRNFLYLTEEARQRVERLIEALP